MGGEKLPGKVRVKNKRRRKMAQAGWKSRVNTNVIEDRLSGKPGNQPAFSPYRRWGCASSHCGADSE